MYLKKLFMVTSAVLVMSLSFTACDMPWDKKEDTKKEESKDKKDDKKDDDKKEEKKDEKEDKGYTIKDNVIENDYYKITLVDGWKMYEQGQNNNVALEIAGNGNGIYLFPHTTQTPEAAAKEQAKAFKIKKVKSIKIGKQKGSYFENSLGTYLYLPAAKGCSSYKISPGKITDKEVKKQIKQIELKF